MKFSIITVVFNDYLNLRITYNSLKKQTHEDFEYIVIDGGSTDKTVDYLKTISQVDKRVRFISESDKGIYDAMNKGVQMAEGDYVVFLGAADKFYSVYTLEEVEELLLPEIDILYGKVVFSSGEQKGRLLGDKLTFASLLFDKYVAHQSVFAKTPIVRSLPFDLTYRFLADQDFMLRAKEKNYYLKYVNKVISRYDGFGFSSSKENKDALLNEKIRLLKRHCKSAYFIRQMGHFVMTREFYSD